MLANHQGCWLVAAALAIAPGCNDVVKDTSDLTPPGVVLEVRGADGQLRPATEATLAAGHALELVCVVTDAGGVSRATLAFEGTAEACLSAGAPSPPGAAVYLTGLPAAASVADPDDGSATATDRLLVTASLRGDLGCYGYDGATRFEGAPRGPRVEVRCTGANWSVNPSTRKAQRTLAVELVP